jgi:hypothetical protein
MWEYFFFSGVDLGAQIFETEFHRKIEVFGSSILKPRAAAQF